MLPDFLVIGAQKCGTTWLHHHLRAHPDIFMPQAKDHGYFCWQHGDHAVSLPDYLKLFASANRGQMLGEATAAYLWTESGAGDAKKPDGYEPDIPGKVRRSLGARARLIALLRNPVERAVSAYIHHEAHGTFGFDTPLLETPSDIGIVDIGRYAAHLSNWLDVYPSEQIMILCTEEDLSIAGDQTLAQVYQFLDVDPAFKPDGPKKPVYSGRPRRWHEGEIWMALSKTGKDTESDKRWQRVVDRETLAALREIYRPDVRELEMITGRKYSEIWALR